MNIGFLLRGLDYLYSSPLEIGCLNRKNVIIIHSKEDKIVSVEGAILLKKDIHKAKLIVQKQSGHMSGCKNLIERMTGNRQLE